MGGRYQSTGLCERYLAGNQPYQSVGGEPNNDDPNIFAIGDCASCPQPSGGFILRARSRRTRWLAVATATFWRGGIEQPLKPYIYKDHGSPVSTVEVPSTVGSLMGNLMRGSMMVEACCPCGVYLVVSYVPVALHGYTKTAWMMLVGGINRVIRPRLNELIALVLKQISVNEG